MGRLVSLQERLRQVLVQPPGAEDKLQRLVRFHCEAQELLRKKAETLRSEFSRANLKRQEELRASLIKNDAERLLWPLSAEHLMELLGIRRADADTHRYAYRRAIEDGSLFPGLKQFLLKIREERQP